MSNSYVEKLGKGMQEPVIRIWAPSEAEEPELNRYLAGAARPEVLAQITALMAKYNIPEIDVYAGRHPSEENERTVAAQLDRRVVNNDMDVLNALAERLTRIIIGENPEHPLHDWVAVYQSARNAQERIRWEKEDFGNQKLILDTSQGLDKLVR